MSGSGGIDSEKSASRSSSADFFETKTHDPEGYTTSYTYDANSNLTQLVLTR